MPVAQDLLGQADEEIQTKLPMVGAFLVIQKGQTLHESYFNGLTEDSLAPTYSVTKGVTALCIGALVGRQKIRTLDLSVREVLPELFTDRVDKRVSSLTLKHLLTMTSGFDWDERNLDQLEDRINGLDRVLHSTPLSRAGERFNYDDANSHLLSKVISKVTGKDLAELAEEVVFRPLGIRSYTWEKDRKGDTIGGYGLSLSARDMGKIAAVYLGAGSSRPAAVPADFIAQASSPQSPGGFPGGTSYGYHGWVSQENGYASHYALGYGGQFAFSIPALGLVAVIACDDRLSLDQINTPRYLLNRFVIPAIESLS